MTPETTPTRRDVPPKATLFCPACDHLSRVDGDWNVIETARTRRYVCPDCRTEIAARPSGDARPSRRRSVPFPGVWGLGLRAWCRVWRRAVFPARTDG